jgi:hypothetical protein
MAMKAICFALAACAAALTLVPNDAYAVLTKVIPVDTETPCPDNAAVNCSATAMVTYRDPFRPNDVNDATGHWHWQVFEAALTGGAAVNDILVTANHRAVPHVPEGFGPVLSVLIPNVVFGETKAGTPHTLKHGDLGHFDTLEATVFKPTGGGAPMTVEFSMKHGVAPPPVRVPEPSTLIVLGTALLGLMGLSRFKAWRYRA